MPKRDSFEQIRAMTQAESYDDEQGCEGHQDYYDEEEEIPKPIIDRSTK